MTYSDFTLEDVEAHLGVTVQPADLFPNLAPAAGLDWLTATLAAGRELPLLNEKSRSEFIVAPILLAVRQLSHGAVAIYSGQRLDVDAARGLTGACDFILAATPPVPVLRAPLVTIVEAKRGDIEAGLGQCVAQMVAARLFNERAGRGPSNVWGCVTSGDDWQFLRLAGAAVQLERRKYYITDLGSILAAFQAMIASLAAPA